MKNYTISNDDLEMDIKKRLADNFQIEQSIYIGDKEVVLGFDNDKDLYLCAYYECNELFDSYTECMYSKSYIEIMKLFCERIQCQCEKVIEEQKNISIPNNEVIKLDQCLPNDYTKSIENKVIVIRPDVLRHEYQRADKQLYLCTGGFGAGAKARGSSCFCTNLYSGTKTRFERSDILGEMKSLPDWAIEKLEEINKQQNNDKQETTSDDVSCDDKEEQDEDEIEI